MTSRDAILAAVRAARPPAVPLPDVGAALAARARDGRDAVAQFASAARDAGADVVRGRRAELGRLFRTATSNARRIVSLVAECSGNETAPVNPHAFADVDAFVCEGTLGVAESGAIWLPAAQLGVRAGLFLATQVVIVLRERAIVRDLHDAYARVDLNAEAFGVFVAGPSKTADIEQALVVGAHGPKALTVLLVEG